MGRNKFIALHGQAPYAAIHRKMRRLIPEPTCCPSCDRCVKLEIANISDTYMQDVKDWKWLCRSCHMKEDGRHNNLLKGAVWEVVPFKGKHHTAESKAKLSLAKKSKKWTPELREIIMKARARSNATN